MQGALSGGRTPHPVERPQDALPKVRHVFQGRPQRGPTTDRSESGSRWRARHRCRQRAASCSACAPCTLQCSQEHDARYRAFRSGAPGRWRSGGSAESGARRGRSSITRGPSQRAATTAAASARAPASGCNTAASRPRCSTSGERRAACTARGSRSASCRAAASSDTQPARARPAVGDGCQGWARSCSQPAHSRWRFRGARARLAVRR